MKADPYMMQQKPGSLLEASRDPKKRKAVMKTIKRKAATGKVSHMGTFEGKSNKLGQGGRAAQLKARGVPGGVIGNLARAAHAAPGQKHYHKKSEKKRKAAPKAMEMVMKGAEHIHHHIHVHGKHASVLHVHMKGAKVSGASFGDEEMQGKKMEHQEEGAKHFKKAEKRHKGKVGHSSGKSFGDETLQDDEIEHKDEEAHGFKKAKKLKSTEMKHKCKGAECKHASHKDKHAGKE